MCGNCIRSYPRGDRPLPARVYIDERGYKYKVLTNGMKNRQYKGKYQDNEHTGVIPWHAMKELEWRTTFDEAQGDLDAYAIGQGWQEYVGNGCNWEIQR